MVWGATTKVGLGIGEFHKPFLCPISHTCDHYACVAHYQAPGNIQPVTNFKANVNKN